MKFMLKIPNDVKSGILTHSEWVTNGSASKLVVYCSELVYACEHIDLYKFIYIRIRLCKYIEQHFFQKEQLYLLGTTWHKVEPYQTAYSCKTHTLPAHNLHTDKIYLYILPIDILLGRSTFMVGHRQSILPQQLKLYSERERRIVFCVLAFVGIGKSFKSIFKWQKSWWVYPLSWHILMMQRIKKWSKKDMTMALCAAESVFVWVFAIRNLQHKKRKTAIEDWLVWM